MEPNNQILTSTTNKTVKADRKRTYAMVAMAVIAVLGVGFGVVGVATGMRKSNEAKDLETQLAEKAEAADCISGLGNDNLSTPVVVEDEKKEQNQITENVELAHDYVYVGAWGKRFKIPAGLTTVSYVYNGAKDYLCVTGVKYIEGGMHYFPKFGNLIMDNSENCMGIVGRVWNNETGRQEYRYAHPQDVSSEDRDEIEWEIQSVNLVEEMLTKNMEDF